MHCLLDWHKIQASTLFGFCNAFCWHISLDKTYPDYHFLLRCEGSFFVISLCKTPFFIINSKKSSFFSSPPPVWSCICVDLLAVMWFCIFFCLTCDFSFSPNNQNNFVWFIFIHYSRGYFILRAVTVASVVKYVCSMGCNVFRKIISHENCPATHRAYFRKCGEEPVYVLPKNVSMNFDVLLTVHLILFILVFNQFVAQNLFYNKFISCLYMFQAPCAHRQEVKIVLYTLWYHHTCRWPSRAQFERGVGIQPHDCWDCVS